ncbi:SGNH/GDSL hydrolase family protein [Nocardioides litoris]|uniref:SGNH/GDSL hydrolase family protein n=1 Tax=Nocardioides litoris TaxID=1926648 RepID=UPI00111F36EA|nr:SGNH/GDSL hydrolase family protein [Nocardioides litoris]
MTRRTSAFLAPALLALVVGLGGCSDDDQPSDPASTGSGAGSGGSSGPDNAYVALGDSYAAAPGVPETDPAAGCLRSSSNYAHLVAEETGLSLVDATCSGADTADVLAKQVQRVTPDTELVTIGIGGNDSDLFTRLIGACAQASGSDPQGSPCTDTIAAEAESTLTRTADSIGEVLDAITTAAPEAQVVVVGYPDLLPARGSCPDLVPIAAGDYAFVNEVTHGLSDALEAAATERDLDFIDLRGPSQGHSICSDDPWINGATTAPDGTIPFHPFAEEQAAVADLVVAQVGPGVS